MRQTEEKKRYYKIHRSITSTNALRLVFERKNIRKPKEFYQEIDKVINTYPMLISPYTLGQCIKSEAVFKQFIPDKRELINFRGEKDPLEEGEKEAVKNLIHMYPDRVLLLATNLCFSFCRFCTRKRLNRKGGKITSENLEKACEYIANNKQIKDVIISGGDPLTMKDSDLKMIIGRIKKIKSVKIIRIGTRAPISNPSRITDNLVGMLKRFNPLYINIHINHPDEFTLESIKTLRKLSDAGIILGSQSVLLKGVNDNSKTIRELFYKCVENGIRPYYLYQCDEVSGTEHFWTDYQKMFEIAQDLIGNISGLAIPNFAFDCKGGRGKVRVIPEFYKYKNEKGITFKTFKNKLYTYKNLNKKK